MPPLMVRPPPPVALLKARAVRVIESSKNENILAGFDQTLGALDRELRDAGVTLDVAVVRARHHFRGRHGAPNFGHFLGTFVDEEDDQFHLRMILHHRIGDVLEEGRLAGARRGDDEAALAHAEAASSNP